MSTMLKLASLVCLIAALGAMPFTLGACDKAPAGKELVTIKGKKFYVDPALDQKTREKGLGGRESIPADGGMIFYFPYNDVLQFVMRDCPVAIDIAFLDEAGRVLAIHEMKPEEPKKPGESDAMYEMRLKRYSSRFPARAAVEVAGGTLVPLGLKTGDVIEFDRDGLKARVK